MPQWTNQSQVFHRATQDGTTACKAFLKPQGGISTLYTAFLEILSDLNFLSLPVDKINSESLYPLNHVRSMVSWEGPWQQQMFVAGSLIVKSKSSTSSEYVALLSFYLPVCLYIDSCRQATQQMIG